MVASLFVAVVLAIALWQVGKQLSMGNELVPKLLLGGYVARLMVDPLLANLPLFSHAGAGGDANFYERGAWFISRVWMSQGIHYVDNVELPYLNHANLQCNAYALVIYLNGGDLATWGCVALGAFVAAVAFLMVYRLARFLGASSDDAALVMGLLYFSPGFFYYTTGTHKEAFVVVCTVGAVSASLRLARKLSWSHALSGAVWLWGLWHVRYYLVFVAILPLAVSFILSRGNLAIRLLAIVGVFAAIVVVAGSSNVAEQMTESAEHAYDVGTSVNSREWNAQGGSGVQFDDGGNAWGALGPKLLYTLFSPFPWTGGSVGLQLGKIDTFLWYYLVYRAWKAGRELWGEDRVILLGLLAFLVPTTLVYASSMANIGLIFRQRFPVVLLTACLSARALRAKRGAPAAAFGAPDFPPQPFS
jgi:hypothetical protein